MSHDDTSPESRHIQTDVIRGLTGAQRFQAASDLTLLAYRVTRAGLRDRYPEANEEQLDEVHYQQVFGPELAADVLAHRRRLRESRPDRS